MSINSIQNSFLFLLAFLSPFLERHKYSYSSVFFSEADFLIQRRIFGISDKESRVSNIDKLLYLDLFVFAAVKDLSDTNLYSVC